MTDIVKTIFIDAPREAVWAALTEKDKIGTWFDPADGDMIEGEDWHMLSGSVNMWGRVLETRPPELLVYTFNHDWLKHDTNDRWELVAKDGGTELTLKHDGFAGAENAEKQIADHNEGWGKHMESLRGLCQREAA